MTTNLTKYEADIERLSNEGVLLLNKMQYEQDPAAVRKQLKAQLGDKAEEYIAKLPEFSFEYQRWYSESKALVKQIIPDRLADFVRHYERNTSRKIMLWDNYTIEDYLQGLSRADAVPMRAGIARMQQQLAIIRSAQQRFKSSLFDIRQLVVADLYDSEIESARALVKNKFFRAAGAVAGVILEKHLAQVCANHALNIAKKNPTIGDLNDLLRTNEVIDVPRWRANQHLADIRNLCDHNKAKEPTAEQVQDLVEGVDKVLKTIF